jgi:hypothetical protein
MNTIYKGDSRYEKIKEQMDLLSITDVTTERQVLNGTIVWQLPIKSRYDSTRYLQYGSFASGYVRNQGVECHSNYQINKRVMSDYEYYPDYKWCEKTNQSIKTGKYNRFQSKRCVPIPIEIDRLEYMMKYVIKNEFIKRAGYDSITRVEHINSMQATEGYYKDKLKVHKENAEFNQKLYNKYKDKFEIAKQDLKFHEERANEYRNTVNDVTVIIDGHKYKLQ